MPYTKPLVAVGFDLYAPRPDKKSLCTLGDALDTVVASLYRYPSGIRLVPRKYG
ncbi:hypothetical protein X777_02519 [Ooceraea biroi]|uniref:Uncharacterized protein n=1 Tax=Ooceraea biroi TaxID=2015173 RepID=A0A026WMW0_OOCBI|nr:hypothetical protein X777_02519 [Ooceraea biroi]